MITIEIVNALIFGIWFLELSDLEKKTITNKKQSFWLCKRQKHELNQIEEISMPKTKTAWIEKINGNNKVAFQQNAFHICSHTHARTHTHTHTHTHTGGARARKHACTLHTKEIFFWGKFPQTEWFVVQMGSKCSFKYLKINRPVIVENEKGYRPRHLVYPNSVFSLTTSNKTKQQKITNKQAR